MDKIAIGDLQNKVSSGADGGWLRQDPPTIKSAPVNRNGVLGKSFAELREGEESLEIRERLAYLEGPL